MASLVLGDDQVVFLDALATVLTEHGHAVGAVARSTAEMVASVRRERPDACLIDRHLARDDDGDAVGRVIEACGSTSVLVLSADPGAAAVGRALDAGASGYLHQSRGVDALIRALDRVLRGEVVVDVPAAGPARRLQRPGDAHRLAAQLTCRERQCLLMLVEGLDTAAMVARLGGLPHYRAHSPAVGADQARRALAAGGRVLRRAPPPARGLVGGRPRGRGRQSTRDPAARGR